MASLAEVLVPFQPIHGWSTGLGLGIAGILLIILEQVGLPRAERFGVILRRLGGDLFIRLWNPAHVVETMQDIYWKRRKIFLIVGVAAMTFVPAYTTGLYTNLWLVRIYLKGLLYLWTFVGAVYLPLMALGGIIWFFNRGRSTYPTSIDHLFGVAFWIFNRGLLLSVPAIVLLMGVPFAVGLFVVSLSIDLVGILFKILACLPLRISNWTHERYDRRLPLMALGLLLLVAGCTVGIVESF